MMTTEVTALGRSFFGCKVCCIRGVPFTNSSLSSHLQTKGHKFMKALYEKNLWPDNTLSSKSTNSMSAHANPYRFMDRSGTTILCILCNKVLPGPLSLFEHQLEEQHQSTLKKLRVDCPTVYYCDVCDLMCVGLDDYYAHCWSKEHSSVSEAKNQQTFIESHGSEKKSEATVNVVCTSSSPSVEDQGKCDIQNQLTTFVKESARSLKMPLNSCDDSLQSLLGRMRNQVEQNKLTLISNNEAKLVNSTEQRTDKSGQQVQQDEAATIRLIARFIHLRKSQIEKVQMPSSDSALQTSVSNESNRDVPCKSNTDFYSLSKSLSNGLGPRHSGKTSREAKAAKLIESLNKFIDERKERIKSDLEQLKQLETARDALLQQQLDRQRDALIEAGDPHSARKATSLAESIDSNNADVLRDFLHSLNGVQIPIPDEAGQHQVCRTACSSNAQAADYLAGLVTKLAQQRPDRAPAQIANDPAAAAPLGHLLRSAVLKLGAPVDAGAPPQLQGGERQKLEALLAKVKEVTACDPSGKRPVEKTHASQESSEAKSQKR